ncbi:unnamed protein product, partial [Meganyctiphanes norvegica]
MVLPPGGSQPCELYTFVVNDRESVGDGLSTSEALTRLHDDIEEALVQHESQEIKKNKGMGPTSVVHEAFHHYSMRSAFRWTSALALVIEGIMLLIAFVAAPDEKYHNLPAEAFFIFAMVAINLYLVWWETLHRHHELPQHIRRMLKGLKECSSHVMWSPANYPHLHSPLSPCISLQWTVRDGTVVNLPWALLVRGDIILLKPGQKVPAKCKPLQESKGHSGDFSMGDIFSPILDGVGEVFSSPKARSPLRETHCIILETPYVSNLRVALSTALNRSTTVFNKQRYLLFACCMETVILPLAVILVFGINTVRLYYNWAGHWTEAMLVGPVCVALPLVPLALPIIWHMLNWFGCAKILTIYHHVQSDSSSDEPFEDQTEVAKYLSDVSIPLESMKTHFINTLLGREQTIIRTANLVHVLASVTSLACVDKKGVLSWPNPTTEKVFFLRNRAHNNRASRSNMYGSAPSLWGDDDVFQENRENITLPHINKESESVLMSLTHDHQTPFGLQFDDPSWNKYLRSLKPLGLNILLNTCNPATQDHYTRFCSHITCQSMYNEDLVPVSQRRCLCELAKQMGFSVEQAQEPFKLEQQLSTFRHVPADMACKDRLARSLMITKLKFPFPHMMSVLMRDTGSRKLELMSQGTADIVLDSCSDYWDGYDICPLAEKDRKKILDFYHRTSLSAYCTAFSYRPTSCVVHNGVSLTNFYMELPIDPTHLYQAARTPTPHISTEALFGDEDHTEYEEVENVDDCFHMQCKQIFNGIVTMQYQAKSDMVSMIEQLDEACIRFVHFSKENELRSRVFSEKMGLESGWNCHISLLSDRTRTESGNSFHGDGGASTSLRTLYRQSTEDLNLSSDLNKKGFRSSLECSRALSHSAPSAINLDVAQVKFEDEVSVCSESQSSQSTNLNNHSQRLGELCECSPVGSEECMLGQQSSTYCQCGVGQDHRCAGDKHEEEMREDNDSDGSRSPSHITESTEDHSTSFNFDMSNRARLPKGIENIHSHLENVDNVPLLVSLFTDCTPPATKTMISIMQEYTEVCIVMGSCANSENIGLFMQADASLAVEPLYPQVCMREPVMTRPGPSKGPSPTDVARILNSLPCSLSFQRDDKVSLVHLILVSRHFMQHVMSCLQFLACCCLALSLLQVLATIAALPPLLSTGGVVWMVTVVIPVLSVSLVGAPTNPAVMNQATGKNHTQLNKELLHYCVLYYATKFVPSILIALLCGTLTLAHFCHLEAAHHINATCTYVYLNNFNSVSIWYDWGYDYAHSLSTVQNLVTCLMVLYFCVISVSFVHRMYQLWVKNPLKNKLWALAVPIVLILQLVYSAISMSWTHQSGVPGFSDIPFWIWLIAFIWPLLIVPVNEAIKRREIRVNVRFQKRARLEFGTKLGMNSPF